jgi:hypothetical protein
MQKGEYSNSLTYEVQTEYDHYNDCIRKARKIQVIGNHPEDVRSVGWVEQ